MSFIIFNSVLTVKCFFLLFSKIVKLSKSKVLTIFGSFEAVFNTFKVEKKSFHSQIKSVNLIQVDLNNRLNPKYF